MRAAGLGQPVQAVPQVVPQLGQLVGRLRGGTWGEVLRKRILDPLGLPDTSVTPNGRAATGYLVDAYSDFARAEVPAITITERR